jgi:hypothetical protein
METLAKIIGWNIIPMYIVAAGTLMGWAFGSWQWGMAIGSAIPSTITLWAAIENKLD